MAQNNGLQPFLQVGSTSLTSEMHEGLQRVAPLELCMCNELSELTTCWHRFWPEPPLLHDSRA